MSLLPILATGAPAQPIERATSVASERTESLTSHNFKVKIVADTGAYYRKVTSPAKSNIRGISAVAVLPKISFDPTRHFVAPEGLDFFRTGPLDRPSVYLGGRGGGHELDAGLTWDRVYDNQGRATYTDRPERTDGRDPAHQFIRAKVDGQVALLDGQGQVVAQGSEAVNAKMAQLVPNFAFRVFWRTTNDGGNQWNQPAPNAANNAYFYPGEDIRLTLRAVGPEQVKMDIGRVGHGYAFSETFRQQGLGQGAMSVKRVASIDQFGVVDGVRKGREKLPVLPTQTTTQGGGWSSAEVIDTRGRAQPMTGPEFTEVRGKDTASGYDSVFRRYNLSREGGERLQITPFAQ